MESILAILSWGVAHYQEVAAGLVALFSGAVAIAMLVPGEQPEKALQAIVNVIAKFSKK